MVKKILRGVAGVTREESRPKGIELKPRRVSHYHYGCTDDHPTKKIAYWWYCETNILAFATGMPDLTDAKNIHPACRVRKKKYHGMVNDQG